VNHSPVSSRFPRRTFDRGAGAGSWVRRADRPVRLGRRARQRSYGPPCPVGSRRSDVAGMGQGKAVSGDGPHQLISRLPGFSLGNGPDRGLSRRRDRLPAVRHRPQLCPSGKLERDTFTPAMRLLMVAWSLVRSARGPVRLRHARHASPIRPSRPRRAAARFSGCYNVMALSGRMPLPLTGGRIARPPRTPAVMPQRPLRLAGPAGRRSADHLRHF
jgi:hypothetical protein